ncbi:hypothetical protein [Chroococcidiopsis sp. CCNUC1]|nr:hypothetical protein [Chroococcidiopsis sp. CCNUC1]
MLSELGRLYRVKGKGDFMRDENNHIYIPPEEEHLVGLAITYQLV